MVQGVQFRRGTTAQHAVFTGQPGEITVDSDKKIVVVHDGSAVGGYEVVGAGSTQRITNKDVNATSLNVTGITTISVNSSSDALRITQTGSGNALVVEDSTNPDLSPFVINASGNLGIGTTNPVTPLHISDGNGAVSSALYTSDYLTISAQNAAPGFNIIAAGSVDTHRGVFKATRARGTLSSPTVPLVNDDTFSLLGAIYDGSTSRGTAAVNMEVDGAVGVGTAPQRITFWTGTGTSRLERARITSTGNAGIGTTNPTSKLTVTGDVLVSGATTITGNLNAPGNYYVKLARLTNQTIPNGGDTLIAFTATSDTNGWYSGITTRTIPTVAGTYNVSAMLSWQAGASSFVNQSNIQIRKNGSTFALSIVGVQTHPYTLNACGIVTMNGTTDYIDFTAYTSNPTSQVVTGTADGAWTKMEIFKIN